MDVLNARPGGAGPDHGVESPRATEQLVRERLSDPRTAASLIVLLDNLDALAFLAEGLNGVLQRGDTITESLASGVHELRALADQVPPYLGEPLSRLASEAPEIADAVTALLESGMLRRDIVDLLGTFADATITGVATARRDATSIDGIRSAFKAFRDPDVARGLGVMVEVARAIGKTV
jgi:hypothetical protein